MWSEQQAAGGPTGIVATTWFVAGSMRETLGPLRAAVVGDPDRAGRRGNPVGVLADGNHRGHLARLRIDPSDDIVRCAWTTHTAPLPAATCPQVSGAGGQGLAGLTLIRAVMTFLCGSMRISVHLLQLSAQTAPSPIVSPPVPSGIAIFATTLARAPIDLGRGGRRRARGRRADHGDCARECGARSDDRDSWCSLLLLDLVTFDTSIEAGAMSRHIGDFPRAARGPGKR